MITKFRFPKIDANIEEATVTLWRKAEGSTVRKGEVILELTTDKGVVEIEAPHSGVVRKILAPVNSTLPVGYILALIGDAHEPLPDVATANRALLEQHRQAAGKQTRAASGGPSGKETIRATPAARRLAREKGIDLAAVKKTLSVEVVNESAIADYLASHNKRNN